MAILQSRMFGLLVAAGATLAQGDLLGSVGEAATAIGSTISEAGAAASNAISDSLEQTKEQSCEEKVQQSVEALNASKWQELDDYCEGVASKIPLLHDQAKGACWWAGASQNDREVEDARKELQEKCMKDESSMSAFATWGQSRASGLTEKARSSIQGAIYDYVGNDTVARGQQAGSAFQSTIASTQSQVNEGVSTLGDWSGNVTNLINSSLSSIHEMPSIQEGMRSTSEGLSNRLSEGLDQVNDVIRHSSHTPGSAQAHGDLKRLQVSSLEMKSASRGHIFAGSFAQPGLLVIASTFLISVGFVVCRVIRRRAVAAVTVDDATAVVETLLVHSDSEEDLLV